MTTTYALCIAPGCYGGPDTTVLSAHRTWDAAKRQADKSDRTCIVEFDWAVRKGYRFTLRPEMIAYMIPRQDHPKYGAGRLGRGLS